MYPPKSSRLAVLLTGTIAATSMLSGCGEPPPPGDVRPAGRADQALTESAINVAASSGAVLGYDVYRLLSEQRGNVLVSPHSLAGALAMAYAGAQGDTRQEMGRAFDLQGDEASLHAGFQALQQQLAAEAGRAAGAMQLHVVNGLWVQEGLALLPGFNDTLTRFYGAPPQLADFKDHHEAVRAAINKRVAEDTLGKIVELMPADSVSKATRLVLTNAIYFKAAWSHPFTARTTAERPFELADGHSENVATMTQLSDMPYGADKTWQAVELPYGRGETSMVLLLPFARNGLRSAERSLNAANAQSLLKTLTPRRVRLSVPKFDFESSFSLKDTLVKVGMAKAFDARNADFSGIDARRDLFLGSVIHKAMISVDENGTEAAAATGVAIAVATAVSAPVPVLELKIDRPFLFLIRHRATNAVLFLGRVEKPGHAGG